MFRTKTFKIVFAALLVLAAAGGFFAYSEYNRRNPEMAELKADYVLPAAQALRAFESDLNQANRQYLDKVLEISGPIRALEQDDKGFYTVVLGNEESMASVRCVIDSLYLRKAATLKAGSTTQIRGLCVKYNVDDMGLGSDLILNRCYPVQ